MRVKVKGYVHMEHAYVDGDWSKKVWRPSIWRTRGFDDAERVFVGEQEFEVEAPDDFNPVPAQVRVLEAEKAAEVARHVARMAEIKDRLSKLLSIANEVPA